MKCVKFSEFVKESNFIDGNYYINEKGESKLQMSQNDDESVKRIISALNGSKQYKNQTIHLEMFTEDGKWVSLGVAKSKDVTKMMEYIVPMVYPPDAEAIEYHSNIKNGSLYTKITNGYIKYIGISGGSNMFVIIYATKDFLSKYIPKELKSGNLRFDCDENKVIWLNTVNASASAKTDKIIEGIYTTPKHAMLSISDLYKNVEVILVDDRLQKGIDEINKKLEE